MQLRLNDDFYVRVTFSLGGVSRVTEEIMHGHPNRDAYYNLLIQDFSAKTYTDVSECRNKEKYITIGKQSEQKCTISD